jgi:hypothetical protein
MPYLAFLLSVIATLLTYWAAPQQRLFKPAPSLVALSALCLQIAALLLWIVATDIASGLFAWLSSCMLIAIALPYLALLRKATV